MPEGLIQNPSTPQLDPDLLNAAYSPSVRKTVRGGDKLAGVKPELVEHWNNLQSEFSKAGIAPEIKSGYRTTAQQQALYNNPATRARTKGNDGITKISPHQRGEALDISFSAAQRAKGRQIIANYAKQNGLQIPSDEPWHVGLRMQKPKPSPSLDPDLMEAGYGQSAAPETPAVPAAQAAPSLDPDLLKAAYDEEPSVTSETSQAAVGLTPGMGAARLMRQRPQQPKQKPTARAASAVSMVPGMGAVRQMRQPRPQPSIADLKRADEQVVDQMFNPERQGVATNFPETKVDPRVLKGEQPSDPMAYAKAQELVGRVDPARSSNPTQEQNEREALERDPAMIAARKRIGSIPAQGRLLGASPRGVASAFQRFGGETVKAVGSAFELPERVLGGLAKQVGLPAPKVQETLNRYGNILSESASMPLNAQGEAIVRSLPEKATDQVTSLGLSLAELIALKRASGLNLGPLMAITSFAKNSDKPIGQRSAIATEAGLMGKVLDQHLSRPMSAVVFGAPTAVESGLQYAQGNKSLEDALLETGIQATAGAVLGGKQKAELGRANEPITETRPEVPRVSEPIPQAQEAQVTPEVGAVTEAPRTIQGWHITDTPKSAASLRSKGFQPTKPFDHGEYPDPAEGVWIRTNQERANLDVPMIRERAVEVSANINPIKFETPQELYAFVDPIVGRDLGNVHVSDVSENDPLLKRENRLKVNAVLQRQGYNAIEFGEGFKGEAHEFGDVLVLDPALVKPEASTTPKRRAADLTDTPREEIEAEIADSLRRKNERVAATEAPQVEPAQTEPIQQVSKPRPELKGTKVVDDAGNPLVVNHGTTKEFDTFGRTSNMLSKSLGFDTYFFASNPAVSSTYAPGEGGRIKQANLDIKNPLVIDAKGGEWSDALSQVISDLPTYRIPEEKAFLDYKKTIAEKYPNVDELPDDVQAELQKRSRAVEDVITKNPQAYKSKSTQPHDYDGVIIKNVWDMTDNPVNDALYSESSYNPYTDVYITFSPKQIHSVGEKLARPTATETPAKTPSVAATAPAEIPQKPSVEAASTQSPEGAATATRPVEGETVAPESRITKVLNGRVYTVRDGEYYDAEGKKATGRLKNKLDAENEIARETVIPAQDTKVGQNDRGEQLYERADGSRYRMRFDSPNTRPNGYPDFGGDLVPVEPSTPPTVAAPKPEGAPTEVVEKPLSRNKAEAAMTKAQQEWGRFGDVVDDLTAKKREADRAVEEMRVDSANLKARQAKHRTTKSGLMEKYGAANLKELEVTYSERQANAADAAKALESAKAKMAELGRAKDEAFAQYQSASAKPTTEVAPKTVEQAPKPDVETRIQERIKAEIPDHAPKGIRAAKERLIRREESPVEAKPLGKEAGAAKLPQEEFDRLLSRGWDLYDQKIKPTFEEWAKKLKEEFGKVDEHLKDVWARINGDEGEVKGVTSIKNAAVESAREAKELPELTPADHQSWERAGELAREQGLDTPDKADAIAKQVLDGTKKQLTDVESAGLRDRLRGIENDYEKLAQATDTAFHPDELADLKVQADLLREKHQVLTDATKKAGTEIARALAIRRSAVDQDMLLSQLGAERSYKVTTGKEPSPEVQKQIKDLVDENNRLKAEVEKHEAARQEKAKAKDLEKVIIEKKIEIRRAGRRRAREVLVQERADIKQRVAAAWKKVGQSNIHGASAIDPEGELSRALGDLARNYIEDGVIKAEDIVDAIHEQIKDVADLTKRQVSDLISGYGKTRESTHDPIEQKLNEVKSILAATSGKTDVLEQGIRPLRRGQQREKPTEDQRRALRELEDAMRQKGPELAQQPYDVKTEQATPLDKAKTTARNRQEQLKSWIATGKREVQGRQQIIPDAELRQLKAENAALERVVAQLNDPAADQKAIERRIALLNKNLVDARAKIQSGEVAPQVKEGAKQPWSPEITELMKERAALSRIAGDMRADAARKAKAAELAKPTGLYGVEGSWADFEARAKKVLASRARLEKQISEYQRRIKQKDFSTKQRAEPVYDAEGNRLRAKLQNVQRDFQRLKDAERKTTVADALVRWKRFAVLSYGTTIGKLTTAASARMAATPLYETAGQIGKRLMPKTFADEPSFKAFLKGEKAAVMQLWQADSFRDFISHLKGGEDLIELLYGKEGGDEFVKSSGGKTLIPRTVGEVLDRPGHLHAALKTVPKRAGFFRAFERGLQKEIEKPNPRDIRDPTVQLAIAGEAKAYEESKRAILQQKNWVTTLFNQAVGSLNRSDARGAKFLGKLLQFRYPITKVPVNYVGETAMHIAGLPAGLGEVAIRSASGPLKARMIASRRQVIKDLAERMPKAMDDLEPEQRQRIARAIKVGGVGLGFVVWGAMRPDQFGGYYQPGKRDQKDVKFGGMRFLGINFPQWMGHIPPLEAAQFGATIRRVHDGMIKKGKEDEATTEGLSAATRGLAEEIPFNQDSLIEVLLGGEGKRRKLLGGEIRSVVPGFVQQGAKASDYPAGTTLTERLNPFGSKEPIPRKPETIKQEVKMGIPGLRQQVPVDENRQRAPVVESFQDRFMKGIITPADLNRARKNSELTQSEVNSMLEEKDLSKEFNPKQLQFFKSPVLTQNKTSPTLDRYERMSIAQREEVKKIMQDKADSLMYSDALTENQKKAFAERLKKVGLLVRGGPK